MKKRSKIVLRQRDNAILKHIYEYRFLSAELLWYLIRNNDNPTISSYSIGSDGKSRPKVYGFKRQALYKRLKQLYDSGYVERHYVTDQPLGRGYGSPRAIYGLGKNSLEVLSEIFEIPKHEVRKIVESNFVKSPFLRHTLELATFRIILELSCKSSKSCVCLRFWQQGESIRDFVYFTDEKGNRVRLPICPDAFFGLRIGNRVDKHYYLEIDRGTEPIVSSFKRSSIRKKLIAFQTYRTLNKTLTDDLFNIRGFQVLIVTPGNITNQLILSGRISNIYQEILLNNNLYTAKSLFLLTTPDFLSLNEPELMFDRIWISQKDNTSLLSLIE